MSHDIENAVYNEEIGFMYDPISGRLWRVKEVATWYEAAASSGRDERIVSCIIRVNINQQKTSPHIMYYVMTGTWLEAGMVIDHRDGDGTNMAFDNLRPATVKQNNANKKSSGRYAYDASLPVGVYNRYKKFAVSVGGKWLGTYDTVEEASAIALAKRKELFGEFVRDEDA